MKGYEIIITFSVKLVTKEQYWDLMKYFGLFLVASGVDDWKCDIEGDGSYINLKVNENVKKV